MNSFKVTRELSVVELLAAVEISTSNFNIFSGCVRARKQKIDYDLIGAHLLCPCFYARPVPSPLSLD